MLLLAFGVVVLACERSDDAQGGDAPIGGEPKGSAVDPRGEDASAERSDASDVRGETADAGQSLPESDDAAYFLKFSTNGEFYRMLRPGDRIDIGAIFDVESWPKKLSEHVREAYRHSNVKGAMNIIQDVVVLEVSPHPQTGRKGATLTVGMAHTDIAALELVREVGDLRVLVRGTGDRKITELYQPSFERAVGSLDVMNHERAERRGLDVESTDAGGDFDGGEADVEVDVSCRGPLAERVPDAAATPQSNTFSSIKTIRVPTR